MAQSDIAGVQDRIVFKVEFIVEIKNSFGQVILDFKLEGQVLSFASRFFAPALPHIDMQDNVVEVRVAGMPVRIPIAGVDMQFDIAFINFSVYLDACAGEVWTLAEIPVSGINDFQFFAVAGLERRCAKQLVVPDTAYDFFRHADGVVFFANFQLVVNVGEFEVRI